MSRSLAILLGGAGVGALWLAARNDPSEVESAMNSDRTSGPDGPSRANDSPVGDPSSGVAPSVAPSNGSPPVATPVAPPMGSDRTFGRDGHTSGVRNNNPLNIEHHAANKWRGQEGHDGRFVIFSHPLYGYRAATRIIMSYSRRGIETVGDIVTTWAPPHENDTESYITTVESISGLARDAVPKRPDELGDLFEAMTIMENGYNPYIRKTILDGIAAA